jgi:hypothetical protein
VAATNEAQAELNGEILLQVSRSHEALSVGLEHLAKRMAAHIDAAVGFAARFAGLKDVFEDISKLYAVLNDDLEGFALSVKERLALKLNVYFERSTTLLAALCLDFEVFTARFAALNAEFEGFIDLAKLTEKSCATVTVTAATLNADQTAFAAILEDDPADFAATLTAKLATLGIHRADMLARHTALDADAADLTARRAVLKADRERLMARMDMLP